MDKKKIAIGIILLIIILGVIGSGSSKNTEETIVEVTPDWTQTCADGTVIDAALDCPDEVRNLSEAEEKQAFYELVELQDKYVIETTDEFGIPTDDYPIKQSQAKDEIAEKFGISREELNRIAVKGSLNDWEMPPYPQ